MILMLTKSKLCCLTGLYIVYSKAEHFDCADDLGRLSRRVLRLVQCNSVYVLKRAFRLVDHSTPMLSQIRQVMFVEWAPACTGWKVDSLFVELLGIPVAACETTLENMHYHYHILLCVYHPTVSIIKTLSSVLTSCFMAITAPIPRP
jgi:hypothetical protein